MAPAPTNRLKLLILGGTTEGSTLARTLKDDPRFTAVLSLAGATANPAIPQIPYVVGGFGGPDGLADYLLAERVDAMIDATHPFAAVMKRNAVRAAEMAGIPILAIRRPEWEPQPGDSWTTVADMKAAVTALDQAPKRVFLTVGQKELAPFKAAPQHSYVIRSVDPPPPERLPPICEVITARGPFDEAAERTLMTANAIEVLVTKNSGGAATEAKLAAARDLAIPVIMVARPPVPEVESVANTGAAMLWLKDFHFKHSAASGPGSVARPSTRRGV